MVDEPIQTWVLYILTLTVHVDRVWFVLSEERRASCGASPPLHSGTKEAPAGSAPLPTAKKIRIARLISKEIFELAVPQSAPPSRNLYFPFRSSSRSAL
jgi:hypothetical protein